MLFIGTIYVPRVGRTDTERNCISNIHAAGLTCAAADKLASLLTAARRLGSTDVALKDLPAVKPPAPGARLIV